MTRTVLIGIVLLGACKIRNESSCDIPGNCVEGDGSMQSCSSSTECANDGVCKLPEGVCVGCVEATDCDVTSTTPVCNTTNNTCEGCSVNAECPSKACDVQTGSCIDETQIAYLEANTSGDCSAATPCGTLSAAFATGRPVIKVQGIIAVTGNSALAVDRDLTVIGDVATNLSILRTTNAATFDVQNAKLSIRDLELSGNTGVGGHAIVMTGATAQLSLDHVFVLNNSARGIDAGNGSKVAMRSCVIAGNLGGGASLLVDFEITNSIFATNGSGATTFGGARLKPLDPSSAVFEFNTVANNVTMGGSIAKSGIDCFGTAFPAHNNIVAGLSGGFVLEQSCTFDHSLFTGNVPSGAGADPSNMSTNDVRFESESSEDSRLTTFFRLKSNSPAIDKADSTSAITVDIDGQSRPQGDEKDIGADEVIR